MEFFKTDFKFGFTYMEGGLEQSKTVDIKVSWIDLS